MSTQLEVVRGARRSWPLRCKRQGGRVAARFAATDALSAYVYPGQDQAETLALAVGWFTAPDDDGRDTQTGYDQGEIEPTITGAQSATLELEGTYAVRCWRRPDGAIDADCIWAGTLLVLGAAGDGTRAVAPYCTYRDVLRVAPWVAPLLDEDTDQEGFYDERLQAREWLDQLVLRSFRGGTWANFGDASQPAANWSGYGAWRSPMDSPWLKGQLAADRLVVTRQVARMCAYKAAGIVGLAQVGSSDKLAGHGAWCDAKASEELQQINAELDVNGDGLSDLVIPLGRANVLYE